MIIGFHAMTFDLSVILKNVGIDAVEMIVISEWDHDMNSLHKYLSKYKNKEFSPNQRLVFINDDIEYIAGNLRLNMWNLQSLLANLCIPNYFCIVLGQNDVSGCLESYRKILTNDQHPIRNIVFQGHLTLYPEIENSKFDVNADKIIRSYIFLNNIKREHRTYMINWLIHNQIINEGLVSYNSEVKENKRSKGFSIIDVNESHYTSLTTCPFSRSNERWTSYDDKLLEIFSFEPTKIKNFTEDDTDSITSNNEELLQRAFLYVASETVFNYPDPYMSEKSFKSFPAMRPMLMLGARGSLSRLRSLGFSTWSNFWDESYDDLIDPNERFKAVANTIMTICKMGIESQKKMLIDMEPILIHNRNLYMDRFVAMQTDHIRSQLLTMLGR